jgi:hypothetical protein
LGTPTRNRICPASAISPISPISPQHHAVHRRHDGVVGNLLGLHGDQPLHRLQIHGGAFVRLRRRGAARDQFAHARHLALEEIFARLQLLEPRPHLAIVEPRQHVALGDGFALAVADFDDAVADDARHLGPAHRLNAAGGIDDFDRGAARGGDGGNLLPDPEAPPGGHRYQQQDRGGNQQFALFHVCKFTRVTWPDIDVAQASHSAVAGVTPPP